MARTPQSLALLPPREAKDPSQLQPRLLLPAWNVSGHSTAQAPRAAADCLANKAFQETPPGEPHNPSPLALWNFNHHTSLSCFAPTQPKKAAGSWDPCGVEWGQRWGLARGGIRSCKAALPRDRECPPCDTGQGKSSRRERAGGSHLHSGQGAGAMPAPNSGGTKPQTPVPRAHGAPKNPEGVNGTNQRCLPCQEHSSAQQ